MKTIKRLSLIFFAVLILAINIPVYAFATGDVVQFTEAAKLGASIVDLYGMANNTSLAYDVASSGSALTVIENLYTEYSSSASDPYTLAAIGVAAVAAGAVAVIYDAVTGQGYIQLYQEQYVSSLDGYWDYQLNDLGFLRDSVTGLYSWTPVDSVVSPVIISSDSFTSFGDVELSLLPCSGVAGDVTVYFENRNNNNCYLYWARLNDGKYHPVFVCDSSSISVRWQNDNNGWVNRSTNGTAFYDDYYTYFRGQEYTARGTPTFGSIVVVNSSSMNDAVPSVIDPDSPVTTTIQSVSVEPSVYIGDPLQNPLEISIPDPASPDYEPQPQRITTTIPWNPDWGNPLPDGVITPEYGVPYPVTDPELLNNAVPDIWDAIVSDGVEIQDAPDPIEPETPSNPSEVFIPLLPVTLPSFNFSFSGIWHYVRDWVSSLGAWLTTMYAVWNSLPYAIVVPVYATAVIVIVLGVYRRFFM